ncbi:hypothetical protein PG993_000066 [Apiospora rasikravindrae]|uniref:Ubiquitin 3 binding protein But2 C-terminal domain-containing protein n=1 Tax=Apiospora rasikravindrae TaxID=990691 RepID=A0ABR1U7H9_9PEZI
MPSNLAMLAALAGGANALAFRAAPGGCEMTMSTSGSVSYPVGQHGSGQTKAGANLSPTNFKMDGSGGLTDSSGRGCWFTPPTGVLQCDVGQQPQGGFKVDCNGNVSYQGTTTFYQCKVPGDKDGAVNVYSKPGQGQDCKEIKLNANGNGCKPADCGKNNGPPSPGYPRSPAPPASTVYKTVPGSAPPAPPASTYTVSGSAPPAPPASTVTVPGSAPPAQTVTVPGSAPPAQTVTVPGSAPPAKTVTVPGSAPPAQTVTVSGSAPPAPPAQTVTVPGSAPPAPPAQIVTVPGSAPPAKTVTVPGQCPSASAPTAPPAQTVTVQGQCPSAPPAPPAQTVYKTVPGSAPPAPPAQTVTAPGQCPSAPPAPAAKTVTVPGPAPPAQTVTVPGQCPSAPPAPPAQTVTIPGSAPPAPPAQTVTVPGSAPPAPPVSPAQSTTLKPVPSSPTGGYPTQPTGGNNTPGQNGNGGGNGGTGGPPKGSVNIPGSCPGGVRNAGELTTPNLIIPVDSAQPSKAPGTSFNGQISSTVSSVFNFDIPQALQGKTCTVKFLFPEKSTLETSDFSFSGSGALDFAKLSKGVDKSASFASLPAVGTALGSQTVKPGNAYTVGSFPCPAGDAVAIKMSGSGTSLTFFEDYNPCPIGLFITTS